jgi:predicted amidophosphoribosyltransferase
MRCSKCGAENPEWLKFCEQRATPFEPRCAKCGFENSPAVRFHSLVADAQPNRV